MTKIFFATQNKGKQREISQLAEIYGDDINLSFPDTSTHVKVEESGATFEQNALLKAEAYAELVDNDTIIVGDDSGLIIPALNNEPGVHSRRWAGYEMNDQELVDYCLEKMEDLHGDDRIAIFETVLVALFPNGASKIYRGQMFGRMMEEVSEDEIQEGFPFRSLFWVDGMECLLRDFDNFTTAERDGFVTHREAAFLELFNEVSR